MKKWLFSNNGKITTPFTFAEAQEYISQHATQNLYAWHPSFTHWMPLNSIDNFDIEVSVPPPPAALPQEFIEEYKNKEQGVFKTLNRINNTLVNTLEALSELDHDVNAYQNITEKLNAEVKTTLNIVRKHYAALQKNIDQFKKDEFVF